MTIVYRLVKGSPLTQAELDGNFTDLDSRVVTNQGAIALKQATLVSGTNLKTINGASLLGSGDLSVAGASAYSALTDAATASLTTINTPLANALAAKAAAYADVDLGTSGGLTLNYASNGNRLNNWRGSADSSVALSTSGAPTASFYIEIAHSGTGGTLTVTGASASVGYKNTLSATEVGAFLYTPSNGVFHSLIPSGGSAAAFAVVTGATTTGSVLTCTPASGLHGTFQWTRDGTNISGATSSTYTTVTADETHAIACNFTPTYFTTNSITDTAPADTTPPTITALSVANSTPGVINATLSEAIKSTMPASAWCSVPGHPITGITYVDSTHINIATSAPFIAGETKSLTVAVTGTNDIQDLAGNVLANGTVVAITDNVVGAASVVDNFNRSDSATIGTASDGTAWINIASGVGIASNRAKGSGKVARDLTSANGSATLIFNDDLSGYSHLDFRHDGSTANNYLGVAVTTSGGLDVFQIVGGSYTKLTGTPNSLVTASTDTTIGVYFENSSIIPSVNGTLYDQPSNGAWNTSQFATQHYVGFAPGASVDTFDNFSAVAKSGTGIADTATRSDSTAMSLASDGLPWLRIVAGAHIASNYIVDSGQDAILERDLGHADTTCSVTFNGALTGIHAAAVIFRGDGTVNNFLKLQINNDGSTQFYTVIGGTAATIGSASAAGTITASSDQSLQIILSGSSLTAKLGSTTINTVTSTQFQTQTWFGLYCGSSGKFKNITIT